MKSPASPTSEKPRTTLKWLVAFFVADALLVVFHNPLILGALDFGAGLWGYTLHADRLDLDFSHAQLANVRLAKNGAAFNAGSVGVEYAPLRVTLDGPKLTIRHAADGTWHLPIDIGSQSPAQHLPAKAGTSLPANLSVRIRNGTVTISTPTAPRAAARTLAFENLHLDAHSDAAGALTADGGLEYAGRPVEFDLATDAGSRAASGSVHAAEIPLGDLLQGVVNTPQFIVEAGRAENVSLHFAQAAFAREPARLHLAGSADLRDGQVSVVGVAAPIRGLHGPLSMSDGGLLLDGISGTLLNSPVHIDGGLGDLFGLQLQLTAQIDGDAHDLRRALSVSSNLALAGPLRIALQVRGPVTNPTLVGRVTSAALNADAIAVQDAKVDLAIADGKLTLLGAAAHSGQIDAALGGTIGLNAKTVATIVGEAHAPQTAVDAILHFADRGGDVLAQGSTHGVDLILEGVLAPDRSRGRASIIAEQTGRALGLGNLMYDVDGVVGGGTVHGARLPGIVDQLQGEGAVARVGDHELDAVDAEADGISAVFVNSLLPGVPAAAIPTRVALAADGDQRALRITKAEVSAPAYRFSGSGLAGREHSAIQGSLAARLAPFTTLASGTVAGPVAVFSDGKRVRVATDGLHFSGTHVAGFPLDGVAGQVDLGPPLRVGAVVASGKTQLEVVGDPAGRLGFSASHLALARFDGGAAAGDVSAAGWIAGQDGRASVILANGSVRGVPLGALAAIERHGDDAQVQSASLRLGAILASLAGTAKWAGPGSQPSYDVAGTLDHAEIGGVLQSLAPGLAKYEPEASVSANVRVAGTGAHPSLDADVNVPTANFNGLPFRDGAAHISADARSAAVDAGRIDAGSSHLEFSAASAPGHLRGALAATHVDIAQLADAIDPTAIVAGHGSLDAAATADNGMIQSHGKVDLQGVMVGEAHTGDVQLGRALGSWDTRNGWIVGHLQTQAAHTKAQFEIAGEVQPRLTADSHLSADSRMNFAAGITNADVASRLGGLGIHAPVSGKIDASGKVTGSLRAPRVAILAQLHDSTILGFTVQKAQLDALLAAGVLQLHSLELKTTGFAIDASGKLTKLAVDGPIALAVHASSAHLAVLLAHALGRDIPADGAASATVAVAGKLNAPDVTGAAALENGKVGAIPISEAVARFGVSGTSFTLSDAEVQLPGGSITVAGNLPLTLSPLAIGPENAPLSLTLGINDITLANFAQFLPNQSQITGTLNGGVALEGTPASPRLIGAIDMEKGKLALKGQPTALDQLQATLHFKGTGVVLSGKANVGGGTVALQGHAEVPNLTDISSADSTTSLGLKLQATKAHFDVAAFGNGTIDGAIDLERIATQPATLKGQVALNDATIPPSTFLAAKPAPASAAPGGFIGATQLGMLFKVGPNVRLRSGAIDLGALGSVELGGTVSAPTLDGTFAATGGTVTYLNRSFRIQQGKVNFDEADGIAPTIDAAATTTVSNPDPNASRNVGGQAVITLTLRGQPDHLTVGLSSEPSYTREQILGLLVDASLVRAVDFNQTDGQNNAGGLKTVGNSSQNAAPISLQNEALGLLDAQFSQSLLSPITSAIGGAVGLSDLGLSVGTGGNVGLTASRRLNGYLSLFFEDSLGVPARQSLGVNISPNDATALSLSVYQEQNSAGLGHGGSTTALYQPGGLNPTANGAASGGATSNGVSVSLKRRFP